jgi:hypothetical protein
VFADLTAVQQFLMDQTVDMAVTTTAQMFSLPKPTVTRIVLVGLPLMARMAESNPEVFRRLHAIILATKPDPIEDLYTQMAESTPVRQAVMDDYKARFGTLFDSANRAAAQKAGTTDGQASLVLAAVLPALSQIIERVTYYRDREAFVTTLRAIV